MYNTADAKNNMTNNSVTLTTREFLKKKKHLYLGFIVVVEHIYIYRKRETTWKVTSPDRGNNYLFCARCRQQMSVDTPTVPTDVYTHYYVKCYSNRWSCTINKDLSPRDISRENPEQKSLRNTLRCCCFTRRLLEDAKSGLSTATDDYDNVRSRTSLLLLTK